MLCFYIVRSVFYLTEVKFYVKSFIIHLEIFYRIVLTRLVSVLLIFIQQKLKYLSIPIDLNIINL